RLAGIPYADSLTAHWAFKATQIRPLPKQKPMNGAGFVIPQAQKRLLGAATFVHQKFAGRVPEGSALIRGFAGGAAVSSRWGHPDDQLLQSMLNDLKQVFAIAGTPLFSVLHRHRQAMPQYLIGHAQRVQEIDNQLTRWPGLALAGSWRSGIGVPDCIDSG